MKYLLFFVVVFAACAYIKPAGTDKKIMTDIKELEKRSEIKFKENCQVLFQEDNLGGKQEAQSWIIFSKEAVSLPKGKSDFIEETDAPKYLADFQRLVPNHSFGELKSQKSTTGFWETKDGNWQATVISTNNGYYLTLEWVKQN